MVNEAELKRHLRSIFDTGVAVVQAESCLPQYLPVDPAKGRTVIFALGKAAGHMARVALGHVDTDEALIVTRHGHMPQSWMPPGFARVIEAGHPNPDEASLNAGAAAIAMAQSLGQDDRLIALISGGGSALMSAPVGGVSFAEKQAINRALLASGAPIVDMNRIRASLSQLKGGRLAELVFPAEVLTYVISDVPGDDPAFVASGPTCPLPKGEDALSILRRYGIGLSDHLVQSLHCPAVLPRQGQKVVVCGKASDALQAMADAAMKADYDPIILGDAIEGDAVQLARYHAELAIGHVRQGNRVALISGGETSVAVLPSSGSGGRNLTYALALAIKLKGENCISALAADSDGIDGTSNAAGAIVLPTTLGRASAADLDAEQCLSKQNSAAFFGRLGDSLITGPTGTNVNDLRVILVGQS